MPKKKIYYMGLLANTDSSILKVNLEHGFKIEGKSDEEAFKLISVLEGLPSKPTSDRDAQPSLEVYGKLSSSYQCINHSEKKVYFITNSWEFDSEKAPGSSDTIRYAGDTQKYLRPVIRLMRLFKEGNICSPCEYYYDVRDGAPHFCSKMCTNLYVSDEPYTLQSSEIPHLQAFIKNTKLPFKEPFLQLAFENFELSYQTFNPHLAFLSLVMSLETLFNRGSGELRYRISRNAAVLLGKNKEEAEMIFSEVRGMYDKRSDLVHTGKRNSITPEDLRKLRYYVRESIKEVYTTGKNKDELLDLLTSSGFGERPWVK